MVSQRLINRSLIIWGSLFLFVLFAAIGITASIFAPIKAEAWGDWITWLQYVCLIIAAAFALIALANTLLLLADASVSLKREIKGLRLVSDQEELADREKAFGQIKRGTLFDLGKKTYYLAARRINDRRWVVVELNPEMRELIVETLGDRGVTSVLSFNQMRLLNISTLD